MEACKRSTQKQKQRVEEQQLGLTVVLPLLIILKSYLLSPIRNLKKAYYTIEQQLSSRSHRYTSRCSSPWQALPIADHPLHSERFP